MLEQIDGERIARGALIVSREKEIEEFFDEHKVTYNKKILYEEGTW